MTMRLKEVEPMKLDTEPPASRFLKSCLAKEQSQQDPSVLIRRQPAILEMVVEDKSNSQASRWLLPLESKVKQHPRGAYKTLKALKERSEQRSSSNPTASSARDEGNIMQLQPTELEFTSTERGPRMRRILLVEPHRALRQALVSMLDQEPDLMVIAAVGSLDEYRCISLEEIDVTVAEVSLPDGDGTDLIREVVPYGVRVVATTLNLRSTTRARALEAGASEVLGKDISFEELVGVIKRVAGNGRARSPFSDDQRSDAPPEP